MAESLRTQYHHDPYLVGNGAWCSTCFPDGPAAGHVGPEVDRWQSQARPGCNECQGFGRVAFSAETIVRNTRAGGPQPDPPLCTDPRQSLRSPGRACVPADPPEDRVTDRPIIFSAPMVRALLAGRKKQTRRLLKPPRGVDPNHWMPNAPGRLGAGITGDRVAVLHWPNDGAEHTVGRLPCAKGDRLWVRENHRFRGASYNDGAEGAPDWSEDEWFRVYGAGGPSDAWDPEFPDGWSPSAHAGVHELTDPGESEGPSVRGYATKLLPSIHMPRWASRLTLVVANVWVEPLNDISEADAEFEGVERESADPPFYYVPGIYPHSLTAIGVEEPGGRHAARSFAKLWQHIHGPEAWAANPWVAAISFAVHRANIDALPSPSQIAGAA